MPDQPIDFQEKRRTKVRRDVADAVMEDMGVDAEWLAHIVGESAPDDMRDAFAEALDRNAMYRAFDERRAKEQEAAGIPGDRCCNSVCEQHQSVEREVEIPSETIEGCMEIRPEGKRDYCKRGAASSQGCLFQMLEHPPNSLSYPSCKIPSHAEAIRMLSQAGLFEADEYGNSDGTDFAFQQKAVRKLWWAYVHLLFESGKIPHIHPNCPEDGDPGAAKELFFKEWMVEKP